MIANPCFHRWCYAQRLVNPAEIVVHVMERHGVLQILQFLRECIGQTGKPAHRHTHREILPLDVAGGNMVVVRIPADTRLASAHAYSGAISCVRAILCRFKRYHYRLPVLN